MTLRRLRRQLSLAMAGVTALVLLLEGCAPLPAQCARPVGERPPPPPAQETRRLVASSRGAAGCHVMLRLPDASDTGEWAALRDSAVREASVAALSCCATPHASNLAAWPAGARDFDLEFACAPP